MPTGSRETTGRLRLLTRDSFDAPGILEAVQVLLRSIPGLQDVGAGVPEAQAARVNARVLIGGGELQDASGGLLRRTTRVVVLLYYRVNRQEADVEIDLARIVDRFTVAFYTARPGGIYGALHNAKLDLSQADTPEYQAVVGPEYRVYPIIVSGTQQQSVPLT